jgi:hypothetical protein
MTDDSKDASKVNGYDTDSHTYPPPSLLPQRNIVKYDDLFDNCRISNKGNRIPLQKDPLDKTVEDIITRNNANREMERGREQVSARLPSFFSASGTTAVPPEHSQNKLVLYVKDFLTRLLGNLKKQNDRQQEESRNHNASIPTNDRISIVEEPPPPIQRPSPKQYYKQRRSPQHQEQIRNHNSFIYQPMVELP